MPKIQLRDIDDLKDTSYPKVEKIRRKKPPKDETIRPKKGRRGK
jgi:hypothetical protein